MLALLFLNPIHSDSLSIKKSRSCSKIATCGQIRAKNKNYFSYLCSPPIQFCGVALLSLLGLLIGFLLMLSFPVYAQDLPGKESKEEQLEPPGNMSVPSNQGDIVLNTTKTDIPVLEKISDNGTYRVQIRWGQPPSLLPENGFDMEIVFLNASAPPATLQTFPTTETNETSASMMGSTGYTDPSLIERMVPIQSYDMIVYSDDGRELWKKENQAVQGGRAYERVTLEQPYTGNITISIQNIKGTGGLSGTIAGPLSETSSNLTSSIEGSNNTKDKTQLTDSVKFTARIIGANP
jgi:hypothetical protein